MTDGFSPRLLPNIPRDKTNVGLNSMTSSFSFVTSLNKKKYNQKIVHLMEEVRNKYRTVKITDVMEIVRNPSLGFDPEPITISQAFRSKAREWSTYPAIVSKEGKTYSYSDYYNNSELFSKALISLGFKAVDVVCTIGFTAPEYLFAMQGSWLIGSVAAGIYTTNSPDACQYILNHSEAVVCVCQGGSNAAKIASIRECCPKLKAIVVYWPESGVPNVDDSDGFAKIYSWNEFLQLGLQVYTTEVIARADAIQPGCCASLIYTSGTTGDPKGVMISHDNAMFNARACRDSFLLDDNDRFVSYLPMNHIAAQFIDSMVPMCNRVTVYMAKPDALQKSLDETMRTARPTFFLAVPRVWEKFSEGIIASILKSSCYKQRWIKFCQKIGTKMCLSRQLNRKPYHNLLGSLVEKTCFKPIRESYGIDKGRTLIVCAAPVTEETLQFFASFNIPLLDLYGQSEGTAPVTLNTHFDRMWKLYTSGRPLHGIECRSDPFTSELQYRGRHVMMGYLKMPVETVSTIDDEGWVHTGDQGTIDSDGFLQITGRLKELIVTAGGENISPVPIELKILEYCPVLSNCVVIGDKRKFLSCLLSLKTVFNPITGVPSDDLTAACVHELSKVGIVATTSSQAKSDPKLIALIEEAIRKYNVGAVSRAQNIRKWILLDQDLSLATGELTATLKLRRGVVQQTHADSIDALYK